MENFLQSRCGFNCIVLSNFDYDKQELELKIEEIGDSIIGKKNHKYVIFSKKYGDLYVKKDEISLKYGKTLLFNVGTVLSEYYDRLISWPHFRSEYCENIKPINSNFYVDIDNWKISVSNKKYSDDNHFRIYIYFSQNKYFYDCNSFAVLTAIKGHEEELFKNIYIEICDCPEWTQEYL